MFNTVLLYKYCYNLKTDYDSNGVRNPKAKPQITNYKDAAAMLTAMDKTIGTDPVGFGNLKTFINDLEIANK